MTAHQIAFIDLGAQRRRLGARIDDAVLRVINHGKYIMGPEVGELEAALTEFCGARHAVSNSSGTDALLLPLMAWGIGRGDAVMLPSFTFAATAEVVALLGATPVFVDVSRDSFNMDTDSLKSALMVTRDQGLKARAIIPVGLFGQPADFDAILAVAREEEIKILDDAAQSFGAVYKGRKVGTLADATATSFFPAKPLGCYGDGGATFTDNDELAEIMRSIRVHGKGREKYDNVRVGLNARLDTIQAAILLQKLKIFPEELERRQRVAARYSKALRQYCQVPELAADTTSAWAQYTLLFDDRDAMQAKLKEKGIPSAVYYPLPLNQQTAYGDCPTAAGGVPNSNYLAKNVLSLPMHPYLGEADSKRIIAAVIDGHSEG